MCQCIISKSDLDKAHKKMEDDIDDAKLHCCDYVEYKCSICEKFLEYPVIIRCPICNTCTCSSCKHFDYILTDLGNFYSLSKNYDKIFEEYRYIDKNNYVVTIPSNKNIKFVFELSNNTQLHINGDNITKFNIYKTHNESDHENLEDIECTNPIIDHVDFLATGTLDKLCTIQDYEGDPNFLIIGEFICEIIDIIVHHNI